MTETPDDEPRTAYLRWLIGIVAALCFAIAVYFASAAISLSALVSAVRAGDGAAVLARTDMRALTRSLTEQIVEAYLKRVGEKRNVSAAERMIVNTYGASVTDVLVSKILTADNLTKLLKRGNIDEASGTPQLQGVPALADMNTSNWFALIGRLHVVKPVLLAIRISKSADPDEYCALDLRFEGFGWKLAGITMPRAAVRQLAEQLPTR